MRGNTITMQLVAGAVAKTAPLYQYDYGQTLRLYGVELPEVYEVHFGRADQGTSRTMLGGADGVEIPNELLLNGAPINVWVFLHVDEEDGETEFRGVIPVMRRARPVDAAMTPEQRTLVEQAIVALNEGVEEAEEAAEDAEAAKTAAVAAKNAAQEAAATAGEYAAAAATSKNAAASSATAAAGSASAAAAAATAAATAQAAAQTAQASAESAAASAAGSATAAAGSATAAAGSATDAAGSAAAAAESAEAAEAAAQMAIGIIDDEAGDGDTDKTWSADKLTEEFSSQNETIENIEIEQRLQEDNIPGTTQMITFDQSGNVSSIVHTDGNDNTVRSDVFTFGTNTITEVRTLSTGESLTIVTNTDTLTTTVTYAAA